MKLRVTELMYNPGPPSAAEIAAGFTDNDDFEYIELVNADTVAINLEGIAFTDGVAFTFGPGMLAPGETVVLVDHLVAFSLRYDTTGMNIGGNFAANLSNGGERMMLVDAFGRVIQDFTYDDAVRWPTAPDGTGPSLEVIDTNGSYDNPFNWQASAEAEGSPGL